MAPSFDIEFWKSFWPGLISSITTGILFSFVLTLIIKQIRKPKLDVCLSIGTGINNRHSLDFYCTNSGTIGLMPNELQWHIYFDSVLQPEGDLKMEYRSIIFDNKSFKYFSGTNEESCLPGTSIKLISIPVRKNKKLAELCGDIVCIDDAKYFYSLTTIKGQMKYNGIFSIFKKSKKIEDGSFVKRRIFEIKNKVL